MSLSIRTNVASLNAQRNLTSTQSSLSTSMARLSSGYRITSAADDAAGLGISTKLTANIRSYNQAARNANDGISIVQSAEAALNETANILTRLRELATESASDGIGNTERGYVQKEARALTDELERIAQVTDYNGTKLLNGAASTLDFQVGIENSGFDRISFTTIDATTAAAGLNVTGLDISSKTSAQSALSTLDSALQKVSDARATLGAAANRFQSSINNIQAFSESLSAANSRIKDVDIAQETSNLAQYQILQQAGISVLAQANQTPQMALKLLGG
jgi:flagellin